MGYPRQRPQRQLAIDIRINAPMGASTFNPELMYELGQFTGIESLFTGINILWGPGLNTHRHAYKRP